MPLSNIADIPSLVREDGHFHAHANEFVKRYLLFKISLSEIRQELDAQICKVAERGITISHLDDHQHIHMLPGIRRIVGELAKKHSIPSIRYPRERLHFYMLREKGSIGRLIQLIALNTFCMIARTTDARRPDFFVGFFYGGNLSDENLHKVLRHLPSSGTCELMCHPGFNDTDSRYRHWQYRWQNELDAITSQKIKTLLQSKGVKLIPYSALLH
jgi:predicted glycoside hydrolase/deacetylase ChbG (UPF0249 family)